MGSRTRPAGQLREWAREHWVELIRAAYGVSVLGLLVAAILGSVLGWRAVNTVGVLGFLLACLLGSLIELRNTGSRVALLVGVVVNGFVLVIAWGILSDQHQLTGVAVAGFLVFLVFYGILALSVDWWRHTDAKQRAFALLSRALWIGAAGAAVAFVFEWNGQARTWVVGALVLAVLFLVALWWRLEGSSPSAAAARLTRAYGPSHRGTTQRDWQHGLARCRQCNRSVDARWDPGQRSDGPGIKVFTCPRCGVLTHFHIDGA